VYRHFARTGTAPSPDDVAAVVAADVAAVRAAYGRLRAQRVLLLEPDGATIRMAPPFSGVPTQHRIESEGIGYHANCAWDALGVVAALRRPGVERVREWCAARGVPIRPLVSVAQLWTLAATWYSTRLQPDSRRPRPDEMREIFAGIGLAGDFWDPRADSVGT